MSDIRIYVYNLLCIDILIRKMFFSWLKMAACKRQHEVLDIDNIQSKRLKTDSLDKNLDNFLSWCKCEGLSLNEKVFFQFI